MNNDNITLSGSQNYQAMKMNKFTSLTQDFKNIGGAIFYYLVFAAPILEPVKVTYIQSSILGLRIYHASLYFTNQFHVKSMI